MGEPGSSRTRVWCRIACIVLLPLLQSTIVCAQTLRASNELRRFVENGIDAPQPQSSSTTATPQNGGQEDQQAQTQLKQQEHQRVLGVMATFNTTRNREAVPLTPKQKFQLFYKSATDPWPFGLAAFVAGIDQAENSFPAYGQGVQGYAKRFGASYADYFTGNFFGNAVLTSVLREDPRYFQKGEGSTTSRVLWAASSTVWCKRDRGTWGLNYANVVGNLLGAAVSNLYYPAADRTVGGTFERGLTVSAEGIIGAEVIEFWPDIVRHHRRKQMLNPNTAQGVDSRQ